MSMSSLPESEAILSMDFSEDYMCHFQNEIQSTYFLTVNFKVVRNSENQITHISRREFVLLPKVHNEEVMEVKTLDSACKIHSMKTTDEALKVKTQPLSCYY